jgi:hypothetical protein
MERIAELSCNMTWSQIRRALDTVQVSNFFNLSYRFDRRNEVSPEASKIFKLLKIKVPNQILRVDKRA